MMGRGDEMKGEMRGENQSHREIFWTKFKITFIHIAGTALKVSARTRQRVLTRW